MNDRQRALYNFLLTCYKTSNVAYIPTKEIVHNLSEYYKDDLYKNGNSHTKRLIISDVQSINSDEGVPKIIISSVWGYKIALKYEYVEWSDKRKRALLKSLKNLEIKNRKAGYNNLFRILFNNGQCSSLSDVESFDK